ncbi:MAG: hypothetical protein ACRD3W_05185, partial [Terriglobales bacterium]
MCAWKTFDDDCSRVIASVRDERDFADPFAFLSLSHSPAEQLKCAQLFCSDKLPLSDAPRWRGRHYSHDRIRVAYISADFRDHAVSYLLAGLFEQHDRRLFETVAVSLFPDRQSEMRRRLEGAFARYIDASNGSDMDAYHVLRELEIDIAVDLMGHTAGARPGIFASRPAPIQVSYLGYPGTTGASWVDYIIADRFVIPEDQRKHYSEKVVLLPETFQANDSKRQFGHNHLSRAEAGLPETGFIFCSFNGNHKIAPAVFNVWMHLLSGVENSVLWLHIPNARAEHNLRREAYARGIEPARIIAAPTLGYSEHLARCRLGDLFLDTFPFNAGATASDALWSGLPLVTCCGDAFASRMAGSLLHAIGLPELIT